MQINKLLIAVVLPIAIGAPIAGFFGEKSVSQPATSQGVQLPFLHGYQTAPVSGQAALASLDRADEWINSPPPNVAALRGKVVLVDFWTYTCVNWLRTLPYVRAWAEKYRDKGLVVIGVHTPEFPFEHDLENVKRATKQMDVHYPVAVVNDYAVWRGFINEHWLLLY